VRPVARIVLDASAAVRLLLRLEGAERIAGLLRTTSLVIVPELYCSEVANALWKYVAAGELEREEAVELFEDALALADSFVSDRSLGVEALAEASARGHPVYDLIYVVAARRNGCQVATMDERLAGLAGEMGIEAAVLTDPEGGV